MKQTQELESPRRYFYWAGLSAISAVVRRNVFLDKFAYKLYPNMYIVLVGKSGLRKGIPVSLAQDLVKRSDSIKVISGRSSIQAVIEELATAETAPDGTIKRTASGFICSGELSQSLLQDDQALTILTNLYDGHYNDEFVNLLKSGRTTLKDVYLSLLGASNEVHLNTMISKRDIMGGFVARTIMVQEDKKANVNALVDRPEHSVDREGLAEHLKVLSTVSGQFLWREDAKLLYKEWYESYEGDDSDDTGMAERVHDHILKVAMCLSLSRDTSLILIDEDIAEATKVCMQCMQSAQKITMRSSTTEDTSQQTAVVLKALLDAPDNTLTRQKILSRYWKEGVNANTLNGIIETLDQASAIKIGRSGAEIHYTLRRSIVEKYQMVVQAKEI